MTTPATAPTPLGRIKSGTSTAITANALTDASRTFDKWMIGEELVIGTTTSRSFTVVGVSADSKTLQTDPADGSMLDVASAQASPYAGLLRFDKITAGPRALLVFDEHASAAGVLNDKSAMVIDPTAAVVLLNEQASTSTTTTPAAGGNIIRDTPLALMWRMARGGRIVDGPDEVHKAVIARRILRSFSEGDGWRFT